MKVYAVVLRESSGEEKMVSWLWVKLWFWETVGQKTINIPDRVVEPSRNSHGLTNVRILHAGKCQVGNYRGLAIVVESVE